MAIHEEHVTQAKKNLHTLQAVSLTVPDSWDWQVTIAYYVAVHLMNSHLAAVSDLHYRTHEAVKNALYNPLSPCKIPDEVYTSYVKLERLSRRARYLCHEDSNSTDRHFTYDKHLKKALLRLDVIINYFNEIYQCNIEPIEIDCIELSNLALVNFKYKRVAA